jgi:hypothetical protein
MPRGRFACLPDFRRCIVGLVCKTDRRDLARREILERRVVKSGPGRLTYVRGTLPVVGRENGSYAPRRS